MNNTRRNFTVGIIWTVPTVMFSAIGHALYLFNFRV
jgi:hypothetical protein